MPLSNGNVVITAPGDDSGANNAGAVYLFNGANGALISALTGSHTNDHVGSRGVVALPDGNFVILSPDWGDGSGIRVGAATWANGMTGVSGVVSAANSLVGNEEYDSIGSEGVKVVGNGNYVVMSRNAIGASSGRGAATWCDGKTGLAGNVSPANSLIGSRANETVGSFSSGLLVLPNGNYLVFTASDEGNAVTWAPGNSGIRGTVSSANSLTGTSRISGVPGDSSGVVVLKNGNFVVISENWDQGEWMDAGAVTWGSADHGVSGEISPSNSLVGDKASSGVGKYGVVSLENGHYLVKSHTSITWCDGTAGTTGMVSPAASLVGYSGSFVTLPNGNYLIVDPYAHLGGGNYNGAVTWVDGSHASSGTFDPANSLTGTNLNFLGSQVLVLANGNYVVLGSGRATSTWGSGTTGVRGVVSEANSLICPAPWVDTHRAFALSNGNYVVVTSGYRPDGDQDQVGAVTWCDGAAGRTGTVGPANSLIGTQSSDEVGKDGVIPLANGNYVVLSSVWKNEAAIKVGAATWCRGDQETSAVVGPLNSLIGTAAGDSIPIAGVALPNGNYLIVRPMWDHGSSLDNGAVTWCPGGAIYPDQVGIGNSLIGVTRQNLGFPLGSFTPQIDILTDGDYVVRGPTWAETGAGQRGSLTWGSATHGVNGMISPENSIVGPTDDSVLGSREVIPLPDGGFLATGNFTARCLVWSDGDGMRTGVPTPDNCLMSPPEPRTWVAPVVDPVNHSYYAAATDEAENGKVKVGSFASGGRSVPVIQIELLPDIPIQNGLTPVNFGVSPAGIKVKKTLRIHNKGNWPLDIGKLSLSPAGVSPFGINKTGMKNPLISGQSTTIILRFTPPAGGNYSSTLSIPNTDRINSDFRVELVAMGNRPPSFAGYLSAGWKPAAVVIPISRLLGRSSDPDGGQITLSSIAPISAFGGTVVISGKNVIYTPPKATGTDSFTVTVRDSLGLQGSGNVTIKLSRSPMPAGGTWPWVQRDAAGRAGASLLTAPNQLRAVEVSEDLKHWRRLATLKSNGQGRITFVDDASPEPQGFYRLAPP
ncbi:MAG: Ig-like domain-containing protein [Luteolibacter sp.]